jgi:hypothetical protein
MSASFAFRAAGDGSFNPVKVPGTFYDAIVQMTADNSYPAGGYPLAVANLPAGGAYSVIESVEVANPVFYNATTGVPSAFVPSWDNINKTVRIVSLATDAELATGNAGANALVCALKVRFA